MPKINGQFTIIKFRSKAMYGRIPFNYLRGYMARSDIKEWTNGAFQLGLNAQVRIRRTTTVNARAVDKVWHS